MAKDFERKVSKEEIDWIQENAPTLGAVHNSIGYLRKHRESGTSIEDIHQDAISRSTEDNHPNLNRAHDFLRGHAERFGLTEFSETE